MTSKLVKVKVKWLPEKMSNLPTSGSYCTIAKFQEDINWPDNCWSIMINFPSTLEVSAESEANAKFLVPEAPWERLKSGCVFEMYEGFKKTAIVYVL